MTKCEVCGKDVTKKEMYTGILKDMPKQWCDECIQKGLYWGLERYTDAVKAP